MEELAGKRVLVTGASGFLGSHLCEALQQKGALLSVIKHSECDLRSAKQTAAAFDRLPKIDIVFHLAARVGGIGANREHPSEFIADNLRINLNVVESAMWMGVRKFVAVGSVCAYPKYARIPFLEENLWQGYPEETNAPYGVAKRALLVHLQALRAQYGFNGIYLIPTNMYGPRDNFAPQSSHVIPALIRKFESALMLDRNGAVTLWGSGRATRDFLYVKDAVEALILAAERYDESDPMNLGSEQEISIAALARYIAHAVGFTGEIRWDTSQPDGQPRRAVSSRFAERMLGWKAHTDFADGVTETVRWYERQEGSLVKLAH